jgi:hypothetical protein
MHRSAGLLSGSEPSELPVQSSTSTDIHISNRILCSWPHILINVQVADVAGYRSRRFPPLRNIVPKIRCAPNDILQCASGIPVLDAVDPFRASLVDAISSSALSGFCRYARSLSLLRTAQVASFPAYRGGTNPLTQYDISSCA